MNALTTATVARIEPAAVMRRAWALFRRQYNFPAVPFASIGRRCFAFALQEAWRQLRAEAAEAARYASILPAERAARIAELETALARLPMRNDWSAVVAGRDKIAAELRRLRA
jgi:hypothetical protein